MRLIDLKRTNFAAILILGLFISGLILFPPIKETFEYNPDEGLDAMKASLWLKGFSLYKQIWSDQPPLFTVMLAGWFKIFGASFYHGRILVLLFMGLLLWTFHQTIRLRQGGFCAWCACVFLVLSVSFLRLGSSIMLGLPSWALAMTAVYLLAVYKKNRSDLCLFLSGLFMALSLQTKFSPAFLLPAILLELKEPGGPGISSSKNPLHGLLPAFFWLIITAFFYSVIAFVFFYPDLSLFAEQLFKPHMARLDLPKNDLLVIGRMLSQDIDIALWALAGIMINLRRKNSEITLPFLWLCLSVAVLAVYRPIWDHYYLFLSLPLSWLAGTGVVSLMAESAANGQAAARPALKKARAPIKIFIAALVLLSIAAVPLKFIRTKNSLWGETNAGQREILKLISGQKERVSWIATDMPGYAFYSGMPVPPEIAVATVKRRFANGLSGELFIRTLQKYRPELILLGEFQDYPLAVMSYINENYLSYSRSLVSARTKGYFSPSVFAAVSRDYIGRYLPPRLRATRSRWFHDLIWRKLRVCHIRIFLSGTGTRESYSADTNINIFLRKDKSVRNDF